ncbi:hypothetical protein FRX31_013606 [Thalictrum thalictroides]|uniref:Uncharacterized protein n=1 Tax=Thalictrum thalictroides TaxID=46969 RepID=A0A7J6WIT1_THATH|nr:hypothetical protein FRX31_013606 [Thalictrum thalictroides]
MEDSVTVSESLMPHLKVKSSEVEEDQVVRDVNEGKKEEEVGDERDKGISPLTPKSSRVVDEENISDGETKRKREDENHKDGVRIDEGGGGVFNNLISNIFHQNGSGGDQDKKEDGNGVVEENKKVKVDKVEESGGGIINNIVSNLPISLPEEAAPPPDEASILIHSIIHD